MFSICIPTYNFDCRPLLNDLLQQMKINAEAVDLIVMDDASAAKEHQQIYQQMSDKIRFYQLKKNVGRAKIRNLLAEKSKQPYLLFIDGDSSVIKKNFLATYIKAIKSYPEYDVYCGGSVYSDEPPSKDQQLRWTYSKARENKSLGFLENHPYQSFTTNNFIIKSEVFAKIKFDERLTDYGHEDTLFGYQLMLHQIPIKHLSNPVLNGDLDKNLYFLEKSKLGINNLLKIVDFLNYDRAFIKMVPLLRTYFKLEKLGLASLLSMWYQRWGKTLESNMNQGKINLRWFDFYRLGVLADLRKRKKADSIQE